MRLALRRIGQAAFVLLGVTLILFVLLRVVPGDPIATMMGEHADQATIERMTHEFGLDRPIPEQFVTYVAGIMRGDFGTSYALGRPVASLIGSAFMNTLVLTVLSAAFAWVMGVACGIVAAIHKGKLLDHLFMGASLLGVSVPVFMVAMLLQYVFAYNLHWLPIAGVSEWSDFVLPAIALGWNSAGSIARLVRSSLLETLSHDYVDTARAKGLTQAAILMHHALRNTMLPVITMMALQFSGLLSGAVITETVFSINGIGRLSVLAIAKRDVPLLLGCTLFCTLIVIVGNLVADSLYVLLDPRVQREVNEHA